MKKKIELKGKFKGESKLNKIKRKYKDKIMHLILPAVLSFVFILSPLHLSAMTTEFIPSLYVTEGYTDNFYQTEFNEIEEFYTIYGIELALAMKEKNGTVLFRYFPQFVDYHKINDQDRWEHNLSLDGDLAVTKALNLDFGLNYDGHGDDNESESWQHGAFILTTYDLSNSLTMHLSDTYSKSYDRQLRSGEWRKSQDNALSGGMVYRFGKNASTGFEHIFSFTEYDEPDADDNTAHKSSIFFRYGFTPLLAFETNHSYEVVEYDISDDDPVTYSGDIRVMRQLSKHLLLYGKYEQSMTWRDSGDSVTYAPSVGLEWQMAQDSAFSLGLGYMIQEWENSENSGTVFIESDIYKDIALSRRSTLTLSASSGYDAISDDAASLGFQLYYQVGALLSHHFSRLVMGELYASYTRDQFDDPIVDRIDNSYRAGGGLSWAPVKWLHLSFACLFDKYTTDSILRDDYEEMQAMVTVRWYPFGPSRMESSITRDDVENRLY